MKVTSWRLIAAIAGTTAVAGGCLAGCGSSSPTVTVTEAPGATSAAASPTNAAQPGTTGLPLGQGTFQIRGSVTEFDPSRQSTAIQGMVDGLALTATATGNGLLAGGFPGREMTAGCSGWLVVRRAAPWASGGPGQTSQISGTITVS
jgi:hypothetical protein